MIEFADVMQRVCETLQPVEQGRKVYNKEIAQALGLRPEYFAVIKKRGKIPYEALAHFSHRQRINLNWLLLGSRPKHLS